MRSILLAAALLLIAAPAAAQPTIQPGQSVTGALTEADPALDDGSRYDVWRFAGLAGHRYRVTLRSSDFDAYLTVGARVAEECEDCARDDDGAGGTDAVVEYTGGTDGMYEIRANSFSEGETGRYELTLVDEGIVEEEHAHDDAAPMGTPIGIDQTVEGELTRGDRKVDGSYNDTYTYQGRAGETISITLHSDDFDALVTVGAYEGGECTEMDANDDGGGGTDSRLTMTLPDDGAYHIHVGSAKAAETGRYTLRIERGVADPDTVGEEETPYSGFAVAADTAVAAPERIGLGISITGWLREGDRQATSDDTFFDVYTYSARAGESVIVEMISSDFDTELRVGRRVDGVWEELGSDDDSGEGTNSLLELTFPESGEYEIHAKALFTGDTGTYHVSVARR